MNKEIFRLVIPNIISNLSIPLLSLVDIALMGHLPEPYFIIAVGFGVTFFNFIYWGFGFLRMGTTGFTAQAFGQNDQSQISLYLFRGFLLALAGSVLLLSLNQLILQIGISFFQTTEEVEHALTSYFKIRILAAPATLSLYVIIGWFLGIQKAWIPMVLTIFINVVNILTNYYFVRVLKMTTDGVALGTVTAQYSGLIVSVIYLIFFHSDLRRHFNFSSVFDLEKIKKFMSVNLDIMVRTMCLILTLAYFKLQSSLIDEDTGAANIVLLEFFTIAAYGIDGFAYAAESLTGKYAGLKDLKNLKKIIRFLMFWGILCGLFFTFVFWVSDDHILAFATSQSNVIEVAHIYKYWVIATPAIMAVAFIWDGVFIGLTASREMRNSMLIATLIVFFPAQYFFPTHFGNHGLWFALILFFVARGIGQSFQIKPIIRKL